MKAEVAQSKHQYQRRAAYAEYGINKPFKVMFSGHGITAVQAGQMIGADTLLQAAERVLVGNVNVYTTQERERDRRIIAVHEWDHFLVDLEHERQLPDSNWKQILATMKTIKISLKANPRTNALGFVFHNQGANLLKTKGEIEHDVRVLLGGMASEELFYLVITSLAWVVKESAWHRPRC